MVTFGPIRTKSLGKNNESIWYFRNLASSLQLVFGNMSSVSYLHTDAEKPWCSLSTCSSSFTAGSMDIQTLCTIYSVALLGLLC